MPPKDPDARRAYDRTYKKVSRAKQKLAELTGKKPGAPSNVSHLPTAATLAHAVSGALQTMTPAEWTQEKADAAMEMLKLGRLALLAHGLEPGHISTKDATKLVTEGVMLFEAALTEDKERRAEGGDNFSLSAAVLQDPEARALVVKLVRLARKLRGDAERLDASAG